MKRLLGLTLGILTAIGGFVDVGDLVASAVVGARFGMALAWATVLGVIGIMLYADMAGRVAAVSGLATFDVVRQVLGPRVALLNLLASMAVNLLTLTAEIGGVALALELASSVSYLLFIPVVGFLVWLVLWRLPFEQMERLFGLAGLALVVFVVAVVRLHPSYAALWHGSVHPKVPNGEGHPTYFYYAIAILGSAMTPYEVFFFSSGGREERWSERDLAEERANVFVGFPLGAILSLAITATAALVLLPQQIQVEHLDQTALPVVVALGKVGLVVVILGFVAATGGAALETALSSGYAVAQYFGWSWGKFLPPARAARFHAVLLVSVVAAMTLVLTTLDPVKITEYSLVFSVVALPLTYAPILVAANDRRSMGEHANGPFSNLLGAAFLILITVAAVVAIPLMVATKAGQ
ncbi:MAG: natural resistance-associated macrophage protein [Frankiales bacterium]|nr:natural resistance-associated macrophage protein [Frankiales bacterium]